MSRIRSSGLHPLKPPPLDGLSADDEWDYLDGWEEPELMREEECLPDEDRYGRYWEDEYDERWYEVGSPSLSEDDPVWETEVLSTCIGCGRQWDLDPHGRCDFCRREASLCRWCGLDPLVYPADESCRTCYQRLRRAHVTSHRTLQVSMMKQPLGGLTCGNAEMTQRPGGRSLPQVFR